MRFFSSICDHISGGGAFTHTTRNILERITKPPQTHTATTTKTRTYARCPSKNACATQTKGQPRRGAPDANTHTRTRKTHMQQHAQQHMLRTHTHTQGGKTRQLARARTLRVIPTCARACKRTHLRPSIPFRRAGESLLINGR